MPNQTPSTRRASPSPALSLRQRIAPNGADLRLMEIVDIHSGLPVMMYVDVTNAPIDGNTIVITDGIFAVQGLFRSDAPVPDDYEILGVGRAYVVPI